MIRSDLERLRDACDFARHARDNAGGLAAKGLAIAKQPQHAALYNLVVIGETWNKVSPELKGAAPNIPWASVVNLRNILVHAYWQIDVEIIADVIENRLDPLVNELDRLVAFLEGVDK